ncbi:hypothetical protein BDK51DRAFT_44012 [Blyttiomyces helicus]|uniref:Uncharacterized protein n=1 Tax=Blyttiomyces helicus TaxID=388810 RepID=A0A4P9W211_9FUNG|nr:hypothetical protein BDK51DRAFT_44012 [Blyttiomyces helicus]|eukprot:RKO86239.1 hypothetical protein BDK51DRAFT_44012 [Blyttiomyces helicus]
MGCFPNEHQAPLQTGRATIAPPQLHVRDRGATSNPPVSATSTPNTSPSTGTPATSPLVLSGASSKWTPSTNPTGPNQTPTSPRSSLSAAASCAKTSWHRAPDPPPHDQASKAPRCYDPRRPVHPFKREDDIAQHAFETVSAEFCLGTKQINGGLEIGADVAVDADKGWEIEEVEEEEVEEEVEEMEEEENKKEAGESASEEDVAHWGPNTTPDPFADPNSIYFGPLDTSPDQQMTLRERSTKFVNRAALNTLPTPHTHS